MRTQFSVSIDHRDENMTILFECEIDGCHIPQANAFVRVAKVDFSITSVRIDPGEGIVDVLCKAHRKEVYMHDLGAWIETAKRLGWRVKIL